MPFVMSNFSTLSIPTITIKSSSSSSSSQDNIHGISLPFTLVCTLLGILILFGNSIVCYAYYKTKTLRTVANKLLISCSLSGIFVAVLFIPFYLVLDDMTTSVSTYVMPISSSLSSFLGFATLFNIGALTVERYIAIFHAYHHQSMMTRRNANIMLFIVWVLPFILSILPFLFALTITKKDRIYLSFKIYQGFLSTLLLLILTVIFIVYIRIWIVCRTHLVFEKQQRERIMSLHSVSMMLDSPLQVPSEEEGEDESCELLKGDIVKVIKNGEEECYENMNIANDLNNSEGETPVSLYNTRANDNYVSESSETFSCIDTEFTEDLTRRLSALSNDVTDHRKMSTTSIKVNGKEPSQRRTSKLKNILTTNIIESRKLSVDWVPRQNYKLSDGYGKNIRKYSVPSYLISDQLKCVGQRRRSDCGLMCDELLVAYNDSFLRRNSATDQMPCKLSNTYRPLLGMFSPLVSIDTERFDQYASKDDEISDKLVKKQQSRASLLSQSTDSTSSFRSCVSKLSDFQSREIVDVTPGITQDTVTPYGTLSRADSSTSPCLEKSPSTRSRVSFVTEVSPMTLIRSNSNKSKRRIKGIMRQSPLFCNSQENHTTVTLPQRSRTVSDGKNMPILVLKKSKSLPLNPSAVKFKMRQKRRHRSSQCDNKSNDIELLCCSESSLQELNKNERENVSITKTRKRPIRAYIKRTRYRFSKHVTVPTSTSSANPCELMSTDNTERRHSTGQWKQYKNEFSTSENTPQHNSTPVSIRKHTSSIRGRLSIPISVASRLSKSRNSYANIILHAKGILTEMKHTRVIAYVFVLNTLCWVPIIFINLADAIGQRKIITTKLILVSNFFFLLNALLMPFLYGLCKHDFKSALKRIIKKLFENH